MGGRNTDKTKQTKKTSYNAMLIKKKEKKRGGGSFKRQDTASTQTKAFLFLGQYLKTN